jgi:hypothetical protein
MLNWLFRYENVKCIGINNCRTLILVIIGYYIYSFLSFCIITSVKKTSNTEVLKNHLTL